jgi:hypothetical protein
VIICDRVEDGVTDLLRSEIIADDFLEAFANALLGNGIQVAFCKN